MVEEPDPDLEIARILDLLRVPDPTAPVETRVLARALNKISSGHVVDLPPRRSSRVPALLVAACVLAILVVVVQLAVPSPAVATPAQLHYANGEPNPASTLPSARDTLSDLAIRAEGLGVRGDGTVQYTESQGWSRFSDLDEQDSTLIPFAQRMWIAQDGSGRIEQRRSLPLHPDGTIDEDTAILPEADSLDVLPEGSLEDYGAVLSRDPSALRSQLIEPGLEGCAESPALMAHCLLASTEAVMNVSVLPGDSQAAFWRMLAAEPDVRSLGETTDRLGRPAIAITHPAVETGTDLTMLILLIDVHDGHYLGSEYITLRTDTPGLDTPAVTSFTTILRSRLVATIGDTE
ncbi:MAG TPA: CU044_5270 family protein [Arachnia sp.]|nr:CU044_5270 family protein [Arachnia sp.]HMT85107.1 CU044_5270 family protein [Arachnia sp.]